MADKQQDNRCKGCAGIGCTLCGYLGTVYVPGDYTGPSLKEVLMAAAKQSKEERDGR